MDYCFSGYILKWQSGATTSKPLTYGHFSLFPTHHAQEELFWPVSVVIVGFLGECCQILPKIGPQIGQDFGKNGQTDPICIFDGQNGSELLTFGPYVVKKGCPKMTSNFRHFPMKIPLSAFFSAFFSAFSHIFCAFSRIFSFGALARFPPSLIAVECGRPPPETAGGKSASSDERQSPQDANQGSAGPHPFPTRSHLTPSTAAHQ